MLERGIIQEEDELENRNQLPAGLRIRKTQHATTLRLLIEAITEFNAEQVDYKEKCEERIQRVVSIGNKISNISNWHNRLYLFSSYYCVFCHYYSKNPFVDGMRRGRG